MGTDPNYSVIGVCPRYLSRPPNTVSRLCSVADWALSPSANNNKKGKPEGFPFVLVLSAIRLAAGVDLDQRLVRNLLHRFAFAGLALHCRDLGSGFLRGAQLSRVGASHRQACSF